MDAPRVLIIGCGDVGMAVAALVHDAGGDCAGLRRDWSAVADDIKPHRRLSADVRDADALRRAIAGADFDYALVTTAAGEFSDQRYREIYVEGLANALRALPPAIKRLFLVSSTRVYHQDDGAWVDEDSPTRPVDFAGRRLLEAENLLSQAEFPSTVVRCSGIYGPGRRGLIDRARRGEGCRRHPPIYTNRIHRDDCAGALAHLIAMDWAGRPPQALYLATDERPAPLWEVLQWLAERHGVELSAERSADVRFRASRRCRNRRLLDSGYRFIYPDYLTGYESLLAEDND